MMHPKTLWNRISIRYKVMAWVIAILLLVVTAVGVSIFSLEVMIRDYENLSIDNYKCYEVQKAIDAERSVFQDLIREPNQRNMTRFTKACIKTQLCIASLPTDYGKIGENRYARTWNLRNGYYGYVERRDKLLAMDTSQPDYTTELYKVVKMQDSLSEYSLRLIHETMEYGNRHYNNQKEILHRVPWVLIALSCIALMFVVFILRLLTAMVVHPILLLAEGSRRIALNDFSQKDLHAKTNDEIGELIRSFNRMKHAMEDYINTREQLHKEAMEKHLGEFCDIFESKNGREALEVFQKEQPQIAILDIEMPGINGLEVARKIRESGKDCAILFLTGFDKFSYAKQAISVRALEYLLKPYNEQELIYAVEEAMQHASRFVAKETPDAAATEETSNLKEEDGENLRLSLIRESIRTYIESNYREDISMQSAAQAMGYSEAYFCKLFKQCFRVNFSAYLNEYRIEKAKVLMADPRINIKDIGIACGYSDSNYFARVFKRITGQTPSDYRLAAAEKIVKGS